MPKRGYWYHKPIKVIRAELNFVKLPLFTLDRKRVGDKRRVVFKFEKKRGKVTQQYEYTILPSGRYGLGGPFDYRVFREIEAIMTDAYILNNRQLTTPLNLGTEYHILRRVGYRRPGKREYEALNIFFERMCGTRVISDLSIYDKAAGRYMQGEFSVYADMAHGPSGLRLWPGSPYFENLQQRYVKLLDHEFYFSIANTLAQRLYELLTLRAFRYSLLHYRYSDLCMRLLLSRQAHLSDAKRILQPAWTELVERDFLSDEPLWKEIRGEKADWVITFKTTRDGHSGSADMNDDELLLTG